MKNIYLGITSAVVVLGLTGCGAYRTDSGITPPSPDTYVKPSILVTPSSLENSNCTTIQNVTASVKKLTAFHANPTKNQADFILAEQGKKLGANAIRNVTYEKGIGLMTWGYIDAKGDASKCDLDNE